MRVSRNMTLGELRRALVAALHLPEDSEFRMYARVPLAPCRAHPRCSYKPAQSQYVSRVELIEEERTLAQEYPYSRAAEVFLERGTPSRKGEVKVSFVYVDLLRSYSLFYRAPAATPLPAPALTASPSPLEYDGTKFSMPLFTLTLKEGIPMSEVKEAVRIPPHASSA